MNESLRQLLYPLGFLASFAFTARFLLQWIDSEQQKKSIVTPLFWKISLTGNILLLLHAFIQIQFHIGLIQICNAVISWRNLNLMQSSSKQWKISSVIALLIGSITALTLIFFIQSHFDTELHSGWFRTPPGYWSSLTYVEVHPLWHALGFLSLLLFNSRFWVQWWGAERHHKSYLGPLFWWMSLIGSLLCLIYFFYIRDIVLIIGPLFGIIPFIRNLMIINKSEKTNLPQQSR